MPRISGFVQLIGCILEQSGFLHPQRGTNSRTKQPLASMAWLKPGRHNGQVDVCRKQREETLSDGKEQAGLEAAVRTAMTGYKLKTTTWT